MQEQTSCSWAGSWSPPAERGTVRALRAQGALHSLWDMGSRGCPDISFLQTAGKYPSQEEPPQHSGGFPLSSLQDHSRAHTAPPPWGCPCSSRNISATPVTAACHTEPPGRSLGRCDPTPSPHLHPLRRPESRLQSLGSSCGACRRLTVGAERGQRKPTFRCTAFCSPLLTPGVGTQLQAFPGLLPVPALLHSILVPGPRGSPGCRSPL